MFKRGSVAYFNRELNTCIVLTSDGAGAIGGVVTFNQFKVAGDLDVQLLFDNDHSADQLEKWIQNSPLCTWYQQGGSHSKFHLRLVDESDRRLFLWLLSGLMRNHGMQLFKGK